MDNKLFKKYYRKLVWIGLVKALLWALVAGFAAVVPAAIVTIPFYLPVKTIVLIAVGVFLGVFLLSAPILYLLRYRPTSEMMNREIDKLGLEERIITMQELSGDSSYIALCQREDATKKLGGVKASQLRFRLSKLALPALGLALVLSVSMTAISSVLSMRHAEIIESEKGDDYEEEEREKHYVTLKYSVEEGGTIEGETEQVIEKGTDGQPVHAVEAEGYIFLKWSDDYIYAERWDWNVLEDIDVQAIFIPKMDGGGNEGKPGDEGGDGGNLHPGGEEGSGGQDNGDQGGSGSSEEDGGNEGSGSGQDDDGNTGEQNPGEGDSGGDSVLDPSGAAGTGGKAQDNTIIDGETDYRTAIDDDYQEDLENDDSIPDELKELIERYLDSLKP